MLNCNFGLKQATISVNKNNDYDGDSDYDTDTDTDTDTDKNSNSNCDNKDEIIEGIFLNMSISFRELLQKRVVIFDGAMGTSIQALALGFENFGGEEFDGCNEYLNLKKPEAIEKIHHDFFQVGCDVVETNTFGATSLVLDEYGIGEQTFEINRAGARIAKKAAQDSSSANSPKFAAGSIGPGTRLPSLDQISFETMNSMYQEQARGLVEGGVDLIIIETCQDILQTKAALTGVLDVLERTGKDLPVLVQVTIEKDLNTMLVGTEIGGALAALEPYPIDVIGINCATGPEDMREYVHYLSQYSPKKISVQPNAGMPENIAGIPVYKLQPEELAKAHLEFINRDQVNIVGGCCGTTPDHLEAVVKTIPGKKSRKRQFFFSPSVSSLYQNITLDQNPKPLIVGERANANGSKLFRDRLLADEYDRLTGIGKAQEKDGAHILDICTAYVDRNEIKDMTEVVRRFNREVTLPMMIDSTEAGVIESALKLIGGRGIVNSVNMEDGEKKIEKVIPICKKFGAAVVALTIDEQGMALTTDKKLAIARVIHDLTTKKYGMRPQDLIFDTLTFTLANPEYADAAINTINAVKRIKAELPGCYTILGVSNISFGLNPYARKILNSVFLYYAVEAGLDLAIVNYRHILPLNQIPDNERELARKVVFNEKIDGDSALIPFIKNVGDKRIRRKKKSRANLPVAEILKDCIINGDSETLAKDLDRALKDHSPLEIINTFLMDGMKVVGELFGSGQMQLPFVLKSAEVMKSAVKFLEPYMDKLESVIKGSIVLATVKGDVHDIGKNLVDIILTNNGYKVYNLGIKITIGEILNIADKYKTDAIGMSGLLVKSTVVMKENLEEMNFSNHFHIPVIVGGAALTKKYVNETLTSTYKGEIYYAPDAFSGLNIMEELKNPTISKKSPVDKKVRTRVSTEKDKTGEPAQPARSNILKEKNIPEIPFFGTRVDEIFPFINKTAMFRGQWQYRKRRLSNEEYARLAQETIEPIYRELTQKCIEERLLEPKVVYGYFYCQSHGNDLIIYREDQKTEWLRFEFPRQKKFPYLCIADYFAEQDSKIMDVIAMHLVTIGRRASQAANELYKSDQYSDYLYLHGISVETAEALAEYWHKKIRHEMNIHQDDAAEIKDLFHQGYRGSSFSFGYPACPNLEDQVKLFELLKPERIGMQLTEEYMLDPEQSTSAIIVHHPAAKYFNVR